MAFKSIPMGDMSGIGALVRRLEEFSQIRPISCSDALSSRRGHHLQLSGGRYGQPPRWRRARRVIRTHVPDVVGRVGAKLVLRPNPGVLWTCSEAPGLGDEWLIRRIPDGGGTSPQGDGEA